MNRALVANPPPEGPSADVFCVMDLPLGLLEPAAMFLSILMLSTLIAPKRQSREGATAALVATAAEDFEGGRSVPSGRYEPERC